MIFKFKCNAEAINEANEKENVRVVAEAASSRLVTQTVTIFSGTRTTTSYFRKLTLHYEPNSIYI